MDGTPINPASNPPATPPVDAASSSKREADRAPRAERAKDRVELDDLARAGDAILDSSGEKATQSVEEIFALAEKVRKATIEYLREVVKPPPPDGSEPPPRAREAASEREVPITEVKPRPYSGGRGAIDLMA